MPANSNLRRSSASLPQLPYDVYGLIVNEVAADSELRPSLKDLSLTQRFLVSFCQRHLFNTIVYNTRNIERLTLLCEVSPHLITYIQNFYYSFSGNDYIVVQFIQKLKGIHKFLFNGPTLPAKDFRNMHPELAMTILAIIHSPDLRWLSLNRVNNYPMRSLLRLRNAPNLGYLQIRELRTDSIAESINIQGSNAPSAPLLDIHIAPRTDQSLSVLLGSPTSPGGNPAVFNFALVRELYVEGETEADVDANKHLIRTCTGLETLICELSEEANMSFEGFADSILAGPSQTLRKLDFRRPIPWITPDDHVCGITEEVKRLSDSHKLNALESLEVYLGIYNAEPTFAEAKLICNEIETWASQMDEIFGQDPRAFPSLREVSITLYVSCVPHREYKYNKKVRAGVNKIYKAAAKKILRECFTNLSGLGLNFNFEMDAGWDLNDWNLGH